MSHRRDGGGEPEPVDPGRLLLISRATSFGQAANVLRTGEYQHLHGRWVAVSHLCVKFPRRVIPQDWSNFSSFVDALERRGGIVSVEFRGVRFDDGSPTPPEDERVRAAPSVSYRAVKHEVERLFGSVLPTHPSLLEVNFVNNDIERGSFPPTLAQLLLSRCGCADVRPGAAAAAAAANPTATSKLHITFEGFSLDDASLHEMARALRRGALASLNVRRCHVDASHFRLLLEAAAESPNRDMDGLELGQLGNSRTNFLTVDETLLAGGVIERMSVRVLGLASGRWTDAAYESLFRQLRTNTTIEALHIMDTRQCIHLIDWLLELINKYNFTLDLVYEIRQSAQDRVNELIRRNRRVNAVHKHMERLHYTLGDEPHHRALWPAALAQVSRFATLVHRFVRRGDVDGLADQLMLISAASRNKKRGRGAP